MIKPKFFGTVHGGRFIVNDQASLDQYLQKFKDDTEMEATFSRKYKRRSTGAIGETTNFNGYYWAVVIRMVSDAMGELDDDYTNDMLQLETGNYRESSSGLRVPKGTKEMSGGEFSEYCGKCRIWASKELQISIPEPNEAEWTY